MKSNYLILGSLVLFLFNNIYGASYKSSDIKIMKRFVDPSAKNCGAAISVDPRGFQAATDFLDYACLLEGNRKVVLGSMDTVEKELDDLKNTLKRLTRKENIRRVGPLSYRPEGREQAMILAKVLESKETNEYLIGILLGYAQKDIDFFYQRFAFLTQITGIDKETIPVQLPEFSSDLRSKFDTYIKNKWPSSSFKKSYELDKKNAKKWLTAHQADFTKSESLSDKQRLILSIKEYMKNPSMDLQDIYSLHNLTKFDAIMIIRLVGESRRDTALNASFLKKLKKQVYSQSFINAFGQYNDGRVKQIADLVTKLTTSK